MPEFFKSILSIFLIFLTLSAMFTMFEVLGRNEKRYNIEKIKTFHKANGIIYFILFIFVSYFCLEYIITSKAELTPRGTFHSIFALTIIVLFGLKITFVHIYRQFYGQVKIIGLLIALITFGMIGTSAGYYLLITKFGTELFPAQKAAVEKMTVKNGIIVRTNPESIAKGRELYNSKCFFCHDPHSAEWIVGPGLKNIMKNPMLPVSKRPATAENIMEQIINPYRDMPSFSYMSEDEILNLIAYLNTL